MASLIRFSTSSSVSGIVVAAGCGGKVVGQEFDASGSDCSVPSSGRAWDVVQIDFMAPYQ